MAIQTRGAWRSWLTGGILFVAAFVILFMVPVPYYIVQPGSALEVRPMIQVEDASNHEKGTFYMTTVSMREGNVVGYLASQVDSRLELVPKKDVLGQNGDPKRYQHVQEEIMRQSQYNAVLAAYREAGRPVEEKLLGVEVFRVLDGMPAAKVLKQGDIIQEADDRKIESAEELLAYLADKKPGERVRLVISRGGDKKEQELELASLAKSGGEDRPGIGIEPVTLRRVEAQPKVTIHADEIGGPSAGLMFSLEILNQLGDQDLTDGLRVAGTGTISPEGKVGQIGGIQHKILAAEKENADIFFVPADQGEQDSNEKKAKTTARKIGSDMAIVPVRTLKEAVQYLKEQEVAGRAS
ncbi:SepM family pheromone-processing serine protease [Desmospora profundinema]|uniref:endopeptidase La n=1 Tax=Desmospora profundinema TaxID=1571184 RepID=A0ABU1IR39_9BACL|nr:SepM family pheromone-processing serine protease [Desmospora profundinema]MDR6227261.1 PDZ domain-containing protein [Desmospora profundinema]